MKKPLVVSALFLVSVVTAGCKSDFSYSVDTMQVSLETEPEGARVYQIAPFSSSRVFMGTTPFEDLTVTVLTKLEFRNLSMAAAGDLMTKLGKVEVSIEKAGYQSFRGHLSTGKEKPVSHRVILDPVDNETADAGGDALRIETAKQ